MKKLNKTDLARMIVTHGWYKPWEKLDVEKEVAMLVLKHDRKYLEEWMREGYEVRIHPKTKKKYFVDISKKC